MGIEEAMGLRRDLSGLSEAGVVFFFLMVGLLL